MQSEGASEAERERRRRKREEREEHVRDIIAAVDLNRNGKIEFNELLKMMETAKQEKERRTEAEGEEDDDEDWEPTREVSDTPLRPSLSSQLSLTVCVLWCGLEQNVRIVFNAADKDRDGSAYQLHPLLSHPHRAAPLSAHSRSILDHDSLP